MKPKSSLLSIFFTLLFAATLTLTGCTAGSLTGPSPDQDEKTVQADQSVNPPAMRNGDGTGRGGHGPGHNTTDE